MEVPEGGLYYSDPFQNLEIALDDGIQHLDGKKALQLNMKVVKVLSYAE